MRNILENLTIGHCPGTQVASSTGGATTTEVSWVVWREQKLSCPQGARVFPPLILCRLLAESKLCFQWLPRVTFTPQVWMSANYLSFSWFLRFEGYGAGGRLGTGNTDSVTTPTLLESIQHISIKKVNIIILISKYWLNWKISGGCKFWRETLPSSVWEWRGLFVGRRRWRQARPWQQKVFFSSWQAQISNPQIPAHASGRKWLNRC